MKHPFNSPVGLKTLEKWLTDEDPDHFSYAHSATAALPFIDNKEQLRLLTIASKHPDVSVRMEAAWATAKIGNEAGIRQLSKFCLDPNYSMTACQYLEELDRVDAIPSKAKSPDFVAKSEFAQWLSHPNELGRPPDRLDIVDSHTLVWPTDGRKKRLWLIKYTVYDDTGLEDDDMENEAVGTRKTHSLTPTLVRLQSSILADSFSDFMKNPIERNTSPRQSMKKNHRKSSLHMNAFYLEH